MDPPDVVRRRTVHYSMKRLERNALVEFGIAGMDDSELGAKCDFERKHWMADGLADLDGAIGFAAKFEPVAMIDQSLVRHWMERSVMAAQLEMVAMV